METKQYNTKNKAKHAHTHTQWVKMNSEKLENTLRQMKMKTQFYKTYGIQEKQF